MTNTTLERAAQPVDVIARQSQTNFYYSFLFLPPLKRKAIETVYAFCRLMDDIVDEDVKVADARTELLRWRQEIRDCFVGHPVTSLGKTLQEILKVFPIKEQYFQDLITGMEMDLTKQRYSSFGDLERYCYHVAGVTGLMCIEIFGYQHESAQEYARNLGNALQLVNIARDLKEDAQRDRIYLPQDELVQFNYSEAQLMASVYNDNFTSLMQYQCQRAESFFQKAQQSLNPADRKSMVAAEIMGRIYHGVLEQIIATKYNVFEHRIKLSKLAKVLLALKAWFSCW